MSDYERQLDDCWAEISGLKDQLDAANERNANLSVELAAMTLERDSLRNELTEARNIINHWKVKATCYGNIVLGCSPVLEAAGFPVDNSMPGGAVRGIATACKKLSEACDAMRQSRNAADDECTRLSIELAAMRQERDLIAAKYAEVGEMFRGPHGLDHHWIMANAASTVNELHEMTQERDTLLSAATMGAKGMLAQIETLQAGADSLRREVEALRRSRMAIPDASSLECECGERWNPSSSAWRWNGAQWEHCGHVTAKQAAQAGKGGGE